MSRPRLTPAAAAYLQQQAQILEELAEELRCRAVDFRPVADTGLLLTIEALKERVENIDLRSQEVTR